MYTYDDTVTKHTGREHRSVCAPLGMRLGRHGAPARGGLPERAPEDLGGSVSYWDLSAPPVMRETVRLENRRENQTGQQG